MQDAVNDLAQQLAHQTSSHNISWAITGVGAAALGVVEASKEKVVAAAAATDGWGDAQHLGLLISGAVGITVLVRFYWDAKDRWNKHKQNKIESGSVE